MRSLLCVLLASALCPAAEQFSPSDVTILGDIDYGQTSPALDCPGGEKYCALVFNAAGGDKVELTVSGGAGKPLVALADGTLKELARGASKLVASLPTTSEPVTYYLIFRGEAGRPGKFTIALRKLP
jgi:hypothetical protein